MVRQWWVKRCVSVALAGINLQMMKRMSDVTRILDRVQGGDSEAADELLPLVFEELRKLAAAKMANEQPGQTLQPTALVHEAWLRLHRGLSPISALVFCAGLRWEWHHLQRHRRSPPRLSRINSWAGPIATLAYSVSVGNGMNALLRQRTGRLVAAGPLVRNNLEQSTLWNG